MMILTKTFIHFDILCSHHTQEFKTANFHQIEIDIMQALIQDSTCDMNIEETSQFIQNALHTSI